MEIIWSVFSCPKEEKERKEIEETREKTLRYLQIHRHPFSNCWARITSLSYQYTELHYSKYCTGVHCTIYTAGSAFKLCPSTPSTPTLPAYYC